MDYTNLREACKIYAKHIGIDSSSPDYSSQVEVIFQRIIEGITFPELGKCDTQQKIDAATVFLLRISSGNDTSLYEIFEGLSDDPEVINELVTTTEIALMLTDRLNIFPDEVGAEFPKTMEYFQTHRDELTFSDNHILRHAIEVEKGKITGDDNWFVAGMKQMLICFIELYEVFQDETGYSDAEMSDAEFIYSVLEELIDR